MKLSKTSWLMLTLGLFIIGFASLGMVRSQQVSEQNQLTEELTLAKQRLSELQFEELSCQQEELEEQLSDIMLNLDAAKATLSQPIGSIAASNTLFDIAEVCGVEVTGISASEQSPTKLTEISCSVLPLTATVEGDVPNLLLFITKVNDDFITGFVKSVEMQIPKAAGESAEEAKKPSANISLVVYAYQGD